MCSLAPPHRCGLWACDSARTEGGNDSNLNLRDRIAGYIIKNVKKSGGAWG